MNITNKRRSFALLLSAVLVATPVSFALAAEPGPDSGGPTSTPSGDSNGSHGIGDDSSLNASVEGDDPSSESYPDGPGSQTVPCTDLDSLGCSHS